MGLIEGPLVRLEEVSNPRREMLELQQQIFARNQQRIESTVEEAGPVLDAYEREYRTSELIERFYEGLKNGNLSRAAALQQAQRTLLETQDFRHPFYWSPFLLIGNWL